MENRMATRKTRTTKKVIQRKTIKKTAAKETTPKTAAERMDDLFNSPEFWAAALPDRQAVRVVHRRWSAAALAIVIEELSKLRDSALRRKAKQHREANRKIVRVVPR